VEDGALQGEVSKNIPVFTVEYLELLDRACMDLRRVNEKQSLRKGHFEVKAVGIT